MCTDPRHQHHLDTPTAEEVAGLSRRGFLRTAAVGAAAVGVAGASGALASPASAAPASAGGTGHGRVPARKISIQLYTVRDQLAADFDGTLDRLA